jgi:hypothetical protein
MAYIIIKMIKIVDCCETFQIEKNSLIKIKTKIKTQPKPNLIIISNNHFCVFSRNRLI